MFGVQAIWRAYGDDVNIIFFLQEFIQRIICTGIVLLRQFVCPTRYNITYRYQLPMFCCFHCMTRSDFAAANNCKFQIGIHYKK